MLLSVKNLKTNRFKASPDILTIPRLIHGHHLCPYEAPRVLQRETLPSPSDPLFTYRHHGRIVPFRAKLFKNCCAVSSVFPFENLSTHSFRRRGTTFASSVGVSAEAIQAQGKSRSTCYERYIIRTASLRKGFAYLVASRVPAS